MNKNKVMSLVAASALVCVLGAGLVGCGSQGSSNDGGQQPSSAQAQSSSAAQSVHEAAVYTADGEKVLVSDLASGKPLVINMWTSWCPNCVAEMPEFQKIVQKYGKDVTFLFVDVPDGDEESPEFVEPWLEEYNLTDLPVVYDTDLEVARAIGLSAYPTTAVYDASGEQLDFRVGAIDPDALSGMLNGLV